MSELAGNEGALAFAPFPKIARFYRDIVITEKIDGTNAAVGILDDGRVYAQSRKRLITPDDDNFGFAKWVADNASALTGMLGVGLHFGEWWGSGVQRGYGLTRGEKRFSLFNTSRWADVETDSSVRGLSVVPTLYSGPFDPEVIDLSLAALADEGSLAAPGFMDPEGIVIFHAASNGLFKVTLKNDDAPKGLAAA